MNIILASTSPYRKQILEKLQIPFTCAAPNVDESRLPDESPDDLVKRLSLAKAQAVADALANQSDAPPNARNALIIGSDQVATFDGLILGKPHTQENAIAQLSRFSGKTVSFRTGLTLLNSATHTHQTRLDTYDVTFRTLSHEQIVRYVEREHVLDCAGSIKCEGLGISLIAEMRGKDPNTLMGLPLIDLVDLIDSASVSN